MNQTLCIMVDCSRNAVLRVAGVKRLIDVMETMGYNALMLYTEDTYEVEGHPLFGYLRGRYSVAELQELVAYGEQRGVELIPCMQTLAHLPQLLRWKEYHAVRDLKDILLAEDEGTYQLIDDMFRALRRCYKSDRIHIGMDEAHDVGLGAYLKKHGLSNRFEVLSRHLERVTALAKKHGFRPIMWSDMFFRLAAGGEYYINDPSLITPDMAALVPEGVELVYWDYYSDNVAHYDTMIEAHQRFSSPLWFAGSCSLGFSSTPRNAMALRRLNAALESCGNKGLTNVMMTLWGDDGGEVSPFSALPSLYYVAQRCHGIRDMDRIKEGFAKAFGVSFDDFLKLDHPAERHKGDSLVPSTEEKTMLYNDPFLGVYDSMATDPDTVAANYRDYAEELAALADTPVYGPLFDTASALCAVLEIKDALGVRTRTAYQAGDRTALAALVAEYAEVSRRLEVYYRAYRALWLQEKKPHGFDLQDIRLGGLKQRLITCRERLEEYLDGTIDRIEELEETILEQRMYVSRWAQAVTVNELSSYFMDVNPD